MSSHSQSSLTSDPTDSTITLSSSSTASFETFNKIHYWLWECGTQHSACVEIRKQLQSRPPTRLIQVGKFRSEPIIKLVESKDLPLQIPDRRYNTLSHCWGQAAGIRLTSESYEEFCRGLQLEALPKTFPDAITLTRYLGMDFIWIDCMCIIQDSILDWENESYRMSDIYHGSFLNIGADAYYTSHGALFHDRDPLSFTPLKLRLRWPPGSNSTRDVAFFPYNMNDKHLAQGPLATRGWVIQERLLAPRTLYFTKDKVIWD